MFYNPSFFDGIVHRFANLFLGSKKDILSNNYYQNDSIGRFLKYLEKNKLSKTKTFYLIHQISPHRPYIFKSNVSLLKGTNLKNGAPAFIFIFSLSPIKATCGLTSCCVSVCMIPGNTSQSLL